MLSEGQELSLQQIREISAHDTYALEILNTINPTEGYSYLKIDVSLFCGDFETATDGLPLRERERFRIFIPKDFPLSPPSVHTLHTRFAGWPHVQWKDSLCLYQSTQTEWNPSDGMFGFFKRLIDWLKHGALNELDPTGQALHPPVTYRSGESNTIIVPRANTPLVHETTWIGFAELKRINKRALSIIDWKTTDLDTPRGNYAAAILLPNPFPFEYPRNSAGLIKELGISGIDFNSFLLALQGALIWKDNDDPLLLVIGTPMRGIKGEEVLKQHLCAWEFNSLEVKALKLSLSRFSQHDSLRKIGAEVEDLFKKWMETAKINWCRILEDRAELVIRRDHSSGLSVFRNKTVSIWGCGALGANIALHLARAGVKKLILRDNDIVTPGVLVRQPYRELDIGYRKIDALKFQIKSINDSIQVNTNVADIKTWLSQNPDWSDGADFIIDCTASNMVHTAFELYRKKIGNNRVPIVSMLIDSNCEKALLIQIGKAFSGGIFDAYRKSILLASREPSLKTFADAFYPDPNQTKRPAFQPEPGCSDPTFIGSSSDSAGLASLMLDCACKAISEGHQNSTAWFLSKNFDEKIQRTSYNLTGDYITVDKVNGYEVRVAINSWNLIQAQINRNNRINSRKVETGGLLFGQRNDVLKIIWIDEASEPPPDSEASEVLFVCGVTGTKQLSELKKKRSRNLTNCVGTWHTHPRSMPFPSVIDLGGMAQILLSDDFSRKKSLLMITRPNATSFRIGGYLFDRNDFEKRYFTIKDYESHTKFNAKNSKSKNLGLALSGGGSRAIAFHLGCLRALNDRDLLDQVDVISSVSGGSVIAALYAYSNTSFFEFEQKVLQLLESGIDVKIKNEFFGTSAWKKELHEYLTKFPRSLKNRLLKNDVQLRRISYRTLCFIEVLRKHCFGDIELTDSRRNDVNTVINASELRTGTAFRFGSKESGCWRFGTIEGNNVSVAEAVGLSSAYPLYLPSLDKDYHFSKYKKSMGDRVVLTDGGIFDNTGVSCMEPGRSSKYSTNVYRPDYIICCNAGYGMLSGEFIPFGLATRLNQVLEATMRKVQDATMKRLHQYKEAGQIKGFILPYLGQMDSALPFYWPDLISREEVNYPTDFRPMKKNDIHKLSARGEQLTRLLIDFYCPDL